MACLIIREAGKQDRLFPIERKESIIGRGKGADIALPHITVSREHAKLNVLPDSYFVENLSGQDNMLVNGEVKVRAELKTKDKIQIGKFTLVFFGNKLTPMEQIFEGKTLDEYPLYTRTSAGNRKDATFQMSPDMVKKMMESGTIIRNARLVSLSDENKSWTPGDKTVQIGQGGQIPVEGMFTGGVVAEISWNGNDHILKKTGGLLSAGVSVNGQKVKDDRSLNSGDVVQIGKSQFRYVISD